MGTAGMFGINDIEHLTAYNEHCKVSLKIWKNCPKMLQIILFSEQRCGIRNPVPF
jgi:hypothetical protein